MYGQVIATEGQRVSLRSPSGEVTAVSSQVEEVALVLCMLLHNAKIATKGMPRAKLKKYHSAILDRLLGNNRAEATRKISQVLDDMFTNHAPDPSTDCTWLDLDTEEEGKISLRHAVDFAHFVDGDKTISRSPRTKIGVTFMDEPGKQSSQPSEASHPTRAVQAAGRSPTPVSHEPNPALDALLSSFERDASAPTTPNAQPGNPVQAEFVAMIASKPHVLVYYMDQCLENSRKSIHRRW